MTVLSLASALAAALGLAGVLPHIAQMLRTRSAGGQSPLGWSIGLSVNLLMAYVNTATGVGTVLVLGNLAGFALCGFALMCVLRLPRAPEVGQHERAEPVDAGVDPHPAQAPPAAAPFAPEAVFELPTGELVAVRDAALEEAARRQATRPRHEPVFA